MIDLGTEIILAPTADNPIAVEVRWPPDSDLLKVCCDEGQLLLSTKQAEGVAWALRELLERRHTCNQIGAT